MPEDEPARKAARQVAEAQKTVAQKVAEAAHAQAQAQGTGPTGRRLLGASHQDEHPEDEEADEEEEHRRRQRRAASGSAGRRAVLGSCAQGGALTYDPRGVWPADARGASRSAALTLARSPACRGAPEPQAQPEP